MKRIIYFVLILLAVDASAQNRKTASGQTDLRPSILGEIDRTEKFTYSYIEVNGDKILDGPFTLVANGKDVSAYEKVTGQFKNGAMDGIWTWNVKFTDIHLPTYEKGRYLTMDAKMTRQYSNGVAEGEWECSYIAKRRDIIFDMKTRTQIPQEYIKSLEEHYNQKAIFHANRLTIENDEEEVIDGVYYNTSDAKNVIVNNQQEGITWEEYLNYARRIDPVEAADILSDLYHRDEHYIDLDKERLLIRERSIDPDIYKTELLNGAELIFTPLWKLGDGFQTSILTPTFYISRINSIQEYNETEITEYLENHSSQEFRDEFINNRAYKSEDLARLKMAYDKKCKEEAEIRRREHELYLFKEDKRDYIGQPSLLGHGTFVLPHPKFMNFKSFYNKSTGKVVSFLEPKFPKGWSSKWEDWYGDGIMNINISNTKKYCTNLLTAFMNASTIEEANSIFEEWKDALKKFSDMNHRISSYKKTVEYQISFPLADIFDKKALTAFMKNRNISDSDEAAALYLKEGASDESYSTIYWAFMKIKNDINPSDFQIETEYFTQYYSAIAKLADYCIQKKTAKRMKTPEELLQAASVTLK